MKIIDLFSEEVIKLLNGWEVRVLILLSLLLQIILIIFGSHRKYRTGIWIKFLVWTTYMGADWVATVALGNLAKIQADSRHYCSKPTSIALQTFWAPFLLLHLGGPDTITAYSLEDNELWSRHFLGLIVEVGVAFYIFFRSLSNTALTFVSIPVFISGIIKYGERTHALRSASNKQFKEALLSANPITENAMRMVMGIKEEDFSEIELMEEQKKISLEQQLGQKEFSNLIEEAHFLFKRFVCLFANLILGFNERIDSFNTIYKKTYDVAFKLVAIELGFMYDVLYTKATLYRTQVGILLRTITFFSTVSALVAFSIVIDVDAYHHSDIYITFSLLGGAVFLEVYAFIILLFSDWTKLWLVKLQQTKINSFLDSLCNKRWSASIGQYNLISFCLEDPRGMFASVQRLPYICKLFEEYQFLTREDVNADMQEMIFTQLQEKGEKIKDNYTIKSCKELLAHRGDCVLNKEKYKLDEFSWSTIDVEFDHSLLVWHIATDICYYVDSDKHKDGNKQYKTSKCLSDYMLYLLVLCPSMMPKGIGEIRYRDTCTQVIQLFKNKKIREINQEVCKMLLEKISKRPITQSILSDGCELARKLQSLEHREGQERWEFEKKWTMISEVWIEMLAYAASHCGWKEHAQQLWKGGELLTHVCLLMAHLGLSEQYNEKEQFYLS